MRKWIIGLVLLAACSSPEHKQSDADKGYMVASWEENLTEAIMVDMFPPPVAARIYAYSNIALHETMRHLSDKPLNSLSGKLNGLAEIPRPDSTIDIDFTLAAITAFSEVGSTMVYTKRIVRDHETHMVDSLKATGIDAKVVDQSIAYGKSVAKVILDWAAKDQFKQTRGMIRYTLLHEAGSWEPTPPDYLPGAEPHWNKIRPFTLDSASLFTSDSLPAPFSTDKSSDFYKNAIEVKEAIAKLDSNQIAMAAFWDDNPGVSSVYGHMKHIKKKRTPGGHWMALIGQLAASHNWSASQTAAIYAFTSIAVFDGFIASWDAKYRFQTIRPITYIHRHITDDWEPLLQTPPFPEYPSGHATISAAAATVLTFMAGDGFSYTDSTQYQFGLPVRSFNSFMEAAEECARSRFYGGIHFMPSNEAGTVTGKQVGSYVLNRINN